MSQSNDNSNDATTEPQGLPVMGKTAFIRAELEKHGYRPQTRAELKVELEAQGFDFSNAIVDGPNGTRWDLTGAMIAAALDSSPWLFPTWPTPPRTGFGRLAAILQRMLPWRVLRFFAKA